MADNSLQPLDIDLSDVNSFEPIPADVYHVAVVSVKNQRQSSTGNWCWDLVLQVIEGDFTKKKIFNTLVYGAEVQGFMAAFLEACGLPYEKGVTRIDPTEWTGKTLYADIIQDDYQGKTRNKVKAFITRS